MVFGCVVSFGSQLSDMVIANHDRLILISFFLLPIEYRVEQLMLGHMFNIINGNAPAYLISGINMNQHRYSTKQGNYPVLFLGLKVLDLHHSCIKVYATGITYHSKLSHAPLKTLLNIKLSVFYIVVYLCRKPVYIHVRS